MFASGGARREPPAGGVRFTGCPSSPDVGTIAQSPSSPRRARWRIRRRLPAGPEAAGRPLLFFGGGRPFFESGVALPAAAARAPVVPVLGRRRGRSARPSVGSAPPERTCATASSSGPTPSPVAAEMGNTLTPRAAIAASKPGSRSRASGRSILLAATICGFLASSGL